MKRYHPLLPDPTNIRHRPVAALGTTDMDPVRPRPPAEARVLWQADLAERYQVDRVTIYRWERANRRPPPDVIIGRRRGRYEAPS